MDASSIRARICSGSKNTGVSGVIDPAPYSISDLPSLCKIRGASARRSRARANAFGRWCEWTSISTSGDRLDRRLFPLLQPIRCETNRGDDVLVAGATAQVSREDAANPFGRRVRLVAQERVHRHQYPRRAETALQRMALVERLLQRKQRVVARRHALDRRDAVVMRLHGEHEARPHRLPVQLHRARSAHAMLAAQVSPGQAGVVADEVCEQQAWLDIALYQSAIDLDRDCSRHQALR